MKSLLKKLFLNYLDKKGLHIVKKYKMPAETTINEKKIILRSLKYSMTTNIRMWALLQSAKEVLRKKIKGDFVECGVWRGGNIILLKNILEQQKIKKNVYGFDTFEGMTEPTRHDVDTENNSALALMKKIDKKDQEFSIWAYSSLQNTKNNIFNNINSKKNLKLIQGKVEDTLVIKNNIPKKISLLRLDTDWYESTKIELEILYPLLQKGGILIIDDYGHFKGCRKAVDEYFSKHKIKLRLHYVDYTCRLIIKE